MAESLITKWLWATISRETADRLAHTVGLDFEYLQEEEDILVSDHVRLTIHKDAPLLVLLPKYEAELEQLLPREDILKLRKTRLRLGPENWRELNREKAARKENAKAGQTRTKRGRRITKEKARRIPGTIFRVSAFNTETRKVEPTTLKITRVRNGRATCIKKSRYMSKNQEGQKGGFAFIDDLQLGRPPKPSTPKRKRAPITFIVRFDNDNTQAEISRGPRSVTTKSKRFLAILLALTSEWEERAREQEWARKHGDTLELLDFAYDLSTTKKPIKETTVRGIRSRFCECLGRCLPAGRIREDLFTSIWTVGTRIMFADTLVFHVPQRTCQELSEEYSDALQSDGKRLRRRHDDEDDEWDRDDANDVWDRDDEDDD